MNITFTYRNLESSVALEESISKHLAHIKKLFPSTIDIHCVLTVDGYRNEAELNLRVAGMDFSAHDSSDDMYKAATAASARLEKQVMKYKAKLRAH